MCPALVSGELTEERAVFLFWALSLDHWRRAVNATTGTVTLKECTWRNSDRWFGHGTNEVIFSPWSKQQKEHSVSAVPQGFNGVCFLILLRTKSSQVTQNYQAWSVETHNATNTLAPTTKWLVHHYNISVGTFSQIVSLQSCTSLWVVLCGSLCRFTVGVLHWQKLPSNQTSNFAP